MLTNDGGPRLSTDAQGVELFLGTGASCRWPYGVDDGSPDFFKIKIGFSLRGNHLLKG